MSVYRTIDPLLFSVVVLFVVFVRIRLESGILGLIAPIADHCLIVIFTKSQNIRGTYGQP